MDKEYKLPKMEFSFHYQGKGKETGINWAGSFRYCRPTLGDRSRIAALRTRLSGDSVVDEAEVLDFNHAVAYLRFTLKDVPSWWSDSSYGLELYDGNVIADIYNKVMDFEADWKKKIHSGLVEDVSDEEGSTKKLVRDVEGQDKE
jgi:hypothetical protein